MVGSYKPRTDALTGPRANTTSDIGNGRRGRGRGGSSRPLGGTIQHHLSYDQWLRNQRGWAPSGSSSRGFGTSYTGSNNNGHDYNGPREYAGYIGQIRGGYGGIESHSGSRAASEDGGNIKFRGQHGLRDESEAKTSDKTEPQRPELSLLEHEYVLQSEDYIDQDKLPSHWGYGRAVTMTHCLDCGETKVDGHLGSGDGYTRSCVPCEVPHNGERCPKLYMTRNHWKKKGPYGKAPTLEDRLSGLRVRPNEKEAAELVRRGYTIFEHMHKRGGSSLKRPLDESAFAESQKRLKLTNLAHLKEVRQAAAEQRSRLKHVFDERALLQKDKAEAREKQVKADPAYADALAVSN
ncbi:hypothetical protein HBI81_175780 [Parastagonospora nodorum]|nr:hypothetical protein HBI57_220350 [Parastagonospora nodorum]KAH6480410.1 hypothetical protein HBI58_078160 [Parastagonospora nodorum]KAH6518146.1 hypothetical protein HBI81_175780 [Parastagonospora nodorum]